MSKTGYATATIVIWFNLCREICSLSLQLERKWEGTITQPIKVDESLFKGKRKYNRWWLRLPEKKPKNEMKKRKISRISFLSAHCQRKMEIMVKEFKGFGYLDCTRTLTMLDSIL